MTVSVVRLGTARTVDKGPRIGTVRRPPRGVPKSKFSSGNWYDAWLPDLSPSDALVKIGQRAQKTGDASAWRTFSKRYEKEMKAATPSRILDVLAELSKTANFAVGCYCEDESRCHRSILGKLLKARGAKVR
jgi:uncharacterized protein YeaO (DUF488 family)